VSSHSSHAGSNAASYSTLTNPQATLLPWHKKLEMGEHRDVFPLVAGAIITAGKSEEAVLNTVSSCLKNGAESFMTTATFSLREYDAVAAKDAFEHTYDKTTLKIDGKDWPEFLIKAHREGSLGRVSAAAAQNKYWCTPTVERSRERPGAYVPSQPLRKAVLSVLHPEGGEAKEYRRPCGSVGFQPHTVEFASAESIGLPSIFAVAGIDAEKRRTALLETLEVTDAVLKLPEELQLGVSVLCYLLKRSSKTVKLELRPMCNMLACLQMPQELEEGIRRRPEWWRDTDNDLAQALSEWHVAIDAADALNSVLNCPLSAVKPELLFGGVNGHMAYKKGEKMLKKHGPAEILALRDSLVEIVSAMVEIKSNAIDFAKYIPGKWTGRLLYDGDWDENFKLTVDGVLDKNNSVSGMQTAFESTDPVEVKFWSVEDGPSRIKIDDGESLLAGEIDAEGHITGVAYSINEKGKKKKEGEFDLKFAGAAKVSEKAVAAAKEAAAEEAATAAAEAAAQAAKEAAKAAPVQEAEMTGDEILIIPKTEDEVVKVESAKVKYGKEFKGVLKKIATGVNNRDWKTLKDSFGDLQEKAEKALKNHNRGIEKGLNNAEAANIVTRIIAKTLILVEENAEADWADKKKLSKDNQAALKHMRQTIKKMHDNEGDFKSYKEMVDAYKAGPASEDEAEEEEDDEE